MTANEQYKQYRQEIDVLINGLNVELNKMDSEQKDNSKNWGYVGNAAEIQSQLVDIIQFLVGEEE